MKNNLNKMRARKPKIEVIKVPTERPLGRPKNFPEMPIMYLELIENKDKIRQDLINKEYVPPNGPILDFKGYKKEELKENFIENSKNNEDSNNIKKDSLSDSDDDKPRDKLKNSSDSDDDKPRDKLKNFSDSDDDKPRDKLRNSSDSDDDKSRDKVRNSSDSENDKSRNKINSDDSSEDEISKKIKNLLKKDKEKKSKSKSRSKNDKSRNKSKNKSTEKIQKEGYNVPPPSLSALKATGQYVPRQVYKDISTVSKNEQEEEDKKRELLFKFELLKKSYKTDNINIPEFTIHSDYNVMVKSYNDCLRRVTLDNTVDTYKQYLIYGFMGVEYLLSNFLKIDMSGFTQQQVLSMNSYERLLIELGEKTYTPTGSNWPVELRLFFMIMINAGFFVVSKMLMRQTGANLMNIFGNSNQTGSNQNPNQGNPTQPKRRMRGPNLDMNNIPDLEKQN